MSKSNKVLNCRQVNQLASKIMKGVLISLENREKIKQHLSDCEDPCHCHDNLKKIVAEKGLNGGRPPITKKKEKK